ncbi:peptidoglycan DD-metalloendopeptidase family protein [Actimicrobium sp. CCC2.4]|uniref:peptidoglycan DD-metalloendopeptidase family protein n=1 Tax=Actimicrobium sp. CCC2.4 TaxID=3048606 RepID=UPI002AC8EE19|nr:peptidoglycan DD-metalloendopeptidase family protein [Actimicrobium sp. CCC2.4]MEB0134069.1 peptidoglycan DD-metalloendopeptidase family protein [Actimicrobium sp. CCC2.4]WPX31602.1 peptidoglycan DD-metalloendopeptidase family protein [Actimicrobium sp. CCC2.4]
MNKPHLAIFLLVSAVLAGCATPRRPAPVVDMATPVSGVRAPDAPGFYTVRKGDMLNRIAQEFGQNTRDIVMWNNLTNPNDIQVDQVLRVLPPAGTAQTGSVAAGSGVDVRPLNGTGATPAKTGPRGDKRPYSEATLAEMQKPDGTPAVVTPPPRAEAPKAVEKKADPSSPEEENVGFIWPTEGKVVGSFDAGKKGIDIAGKSGQAVIASGAGKVMYAGSGIRGYGNLVIVKHTSNLLSAYAHNKSILVKEGQTVTRGEKIAEMGNSDSDSVKLHFEIRQQGKPVDPAKFLPGR